MDRKEIVKRFFENGILVTPRILDEVTDENIEEIILKYKQKPKKVIKKLKENHTVEIKYPKERKKLKVNDYLELYKERLNSLKGILMRKMEVVSINNIKPNSNSISLIGMVKETNEKGVVIEDQTGEIVVVFKEKKGVSVDDVVGIRGSSRGKDVFCEELVYPEIPMPKTTKTSDMKLIFTTEIPKNIEKNDMVFFFGGAPEVGGIHVIEKVPAKIDTNNLKMLVLDENKTLNEKNITEFLKKRYIPGSDVIKYEKNPLLLEEVPDFIIIRGDREWSRIYKGVTVISFKDTVKIDMNTHEIKFPDKKSV